MSGNTSETRCVYMGCDREEKHWSHTVYEDKPIHIDNHPFQAPPEGEAVPEQKILCPKCAGTGLCLMRINAIGRDYGHIALVHCYSCGEDFKLSNLDDFAKFFLKPAPVVSTAAPEPPDARKAVEDWFKLPNHDLEFRHRSDLCEGTNIIDVTCTFCRIITAMAAYKRESAATPKPIGDVEAVARQICAVFAGKPNKCIHCGHELVMGGAIASGMVRYCPNNPNGHSYMITIGGEDERPKQVAAILGPFFAPAPPCSECATPSEINLPWTVSGDSPSNPPMVWDASGDSIVNQMPDGTPYFEPEVAAFIGKAANSLAAHELECATLRKERDDALEWFRRDYGLPEDGDFVTVMRLIDDARGRAEAVEAQLSTLRDALRSIEELALACINTHAHETTCANMDVIQGIAEAALAPTPEVAPKEGQN